MLHFDYVIPISKFDIFVQDIQITVFSTKKWHSQPRSEFLEYSNQTSYFLPKQPQFRDETVIKKGYSRPNHPNSGSLPLIGIF